MWHHLYTQQMFYGGSIYVITLFLTSLTEKKEKNGTSGLDLYLSQDIQLPHTLNP